MKPIRKEELFENLSDFLKNKGVQLNDGSYTKGIHAGCSMLADAINLSQAGLVKAKTEIGRKVEQVRQAIHKKTAPTSPKTASSSKPGAKSAGKAPRPKSKSRATRPTARKSKSK